MVKFSVYYMKYTTTDWDKELSEQDSPEKICYNVRSRKRLVQIVRRKEHNEDLSIHVTEAGIIYYEVPEEEIDTFKHFIVKHDVTIKN